MQFITIVLDFINLMILNRLSCTAVLILFLLGLGKTCCASGALSDINNDFHQAYENHVDEILQKIGAPGGIPVILNLGGRFVFKYNGQSESVNTTPAQFHIIKAFSHSLFATALILQHLPEGSLPIDARDKLIALQKHLRQSVAEIEQLDLSHKEKILVRNLAQYNLSYIHSLLKNNQFSEQANTLFFAEHQIELEIAIKAVVKRQLSLIDKTVNRWLSILSDDEREKLGVVVATVHQARADEVSLQYFANKFSYQYGEGAQHEKGFVVLEGQFDEASALKLLARHYLDREAATTLFNNPERLQSDLLGPAAGEILATIFQNKNDGNQPHL